MKKEKKKNIGAYCLVGILIILSIVACLFTYKSKNKTLEKKDTSLASTLKEEILKDAKKVVETRNWEDNNQNFTFSVSLTDFKEKYGMDITNFIDKGNCNMDDTYVNITISNGSASYDVYLSCQNAK